MSRTLSTPIPKISVVIPVFNAASHIEDCLTRVFSSTFREFEVIIIDDGSGDDTVNKARRFPCRILSNETNRGPAASRNRGVNKSRAEIILFLDADVMIPPALIGNVWNFFQQHSEVSVLQGRYGDKPYFRDIVSQYKHLIFSFRGWAAAGSYVSYIHTACVAIRKRVFEKCRFDEQLKRREDIEFGLRVSEMGFLIYADPEIKVEHKKKYDLISFTRYQFRAAKELTLQFLVSKNRNLTREFSSKKNPLYKKTWLFRPLLSFFLFVSAIWLVFDKTVFPILVMVGVFAVSILLEYPFRLYLLRTAPLRISVAACGLYFYDGLVLLAGVLGGILQAIIIFLKTIRVVLLGRGK